MYVEKYGQRKWLSPWHNVGWVELASNGDLKFHGDGVVKGALSQYATEHLPTTEIQWKSGGKILIVENGGVYTIYDDQCKPTWSVNWNNAGT